MIKIKSHICCKCKKIYKLNNFVKSKKMKYGITYICKGCKRKLDALYCKSDKYKEWYKKNKYKQKLSHEKYKRTKKYKNTRKKYLKSKEYKKYVMKSIKKHRDKIKVIMKFNNTLIRTKIIKRQPCCVCGSTKNVHAHHDDYNKPFEVIWLCALHHIHLHNSKDKAYKLYGNLLPTQNNGYYV